MEDFTPRLLADAGIGLGQRVLDIGCGTGAVTRMISERVGPSGDIVGIDRNADGLKIARASLADVGLTNARFIEMDINALSEEIGHFDAIVGRRVLMYQRDAVATLRHLAKVLKPGGLLILQEHDASATPMQRAALPLHKRIHGLIWETVRREGADSNIGFNLPLALKSAGFVIDQIRAEATVLPAAPASHPIEDIVRAMLPRMIDQGVVTEGELQVEGLNLRLAEERQENNTICLWELIFGIKAHI